jgi:hypothetical protein
LRHRGLPDQRTHYAGLGEKTVTLSRNKATFGYLPDNPSDRLTVTWCREENIARRGQDYVTLFVDINQARVMFATEGNDAATIAAFADGLTAHGSDLDRMARSAERPAQRSMILSLIDADCAPALTCKRIGPPLLFERLWRDTWCEVVAELFADRGFEFRVECAVFLTFLHRR